MPLPAGVTTCTVSAGPLADFAGDPYVLSVEWQPILDGSAKAGNVRSIVWAATGEPLASFPETVTSESGEQVTFALPHTDQAGFIDGTGAAVTGWWYEVTVTASGRPASRKKYTKTKRIQVLVGQETADFDMIPDGKVLIPATTPTPTVISVNGATGAVTVPSTGDLALLQPIATLPQDVAAHVSDGSALDTSIAAKIATALAAGDFVTASEMLVALASKADLVGGVVPTSQIPAVALTAGQAVANRAAMLALTDVQPGDFVAITATADKGTYILTDSGPSSSFSNWLPLSVPTDVVSSVNGQSGIVVLTKGDVGLGAVDDTADLDKPVSTAQASADALLQPIATLADATAPHVSDGSALDVAIAAKMGTRVQTNTPTVMTATTTLSTLLTAPVGANQEWLVEGHLIVDSSQAADFKMQLQASGATGATGYFGVVPALKGSASSTTTETLNPINAVAVAASGGASIGCGTVGVGSLQMIAFKGYVKTLATAGSLAIRVAPVASDATNTTVSYAQMNCIRLS